MSRVTAVSILRGHRPHSTGSLCGLLLVWSGGATDDVVNSPPQLPSLSDPDPIRDTPGSKVKDDSGLRPLPQKAQSF